MKRIISLLFLGALASGGFAQIPMFDETDAFVGGQDQDHDKNRLLFSNPADTSFRFDIKVRMSYDEGKTWPIDKLIKKGTGAYLCLTVFPDGTIGIIYETGSFNKDIKEYYARLSFARFNLEWLTDGKDHLLPAQ